MTARFAAPTLIAAILFCACGDDEPPAEDAGEIDVVDVQPDVVEDVEPPDGACDHWDAMRQPFFGDLHVHTALSLDASLQGTRLMPADAYRFARGEALGIQPYDEDGVGQRSVQLARPLDFAAVTDHAEFLGLITACNDPDAVAYESDDCVQYRENPDGAFIALNALTAASQEGVRHPSGCGEDGVDCEEPAAAAWALTIGAAEDANDTSAECGFTALIGYEWTANPGTENLHRNVIFRSEVVPDRAFSYMTEPYAEELWAALRAECLDAGSGCDALTIPHNSNLSNGRMFDSAQLPMDEVYAAERREMEPLFEIFQHKGDSECWIGVLAEDERCGFEKMPYNSLATANLGIPVETNPVDFVRAAMGLGLQLSQSLGVNPFEYGFIASTDTHIAAPGLVSESGFPGHGGAGQGHRDEMPVGLPDAIAFNPGGLAGVWAEENSRASIFDALRRRETYGTSGPRITVRFFGGAGLSQQMCEDPNLVRTGYADGVPMGGVLAAAGGAPTFVVSALADPGAPAVGAAAADPSTPLQQIEIVKGWVEGNEPRFEVFAVAGDPTAGTDPGVDPTTCAPMDAGSASLCGTWTDPDFDPEVPAYYYARVVEIPTCRWSTHQCAAAGVDCDDPDTVGDGFEGCCDAAYERFIQERAWTSPIWHRPDTP